MNKLDEGLSAITNFFDSLGPNDIYKKILLEVLFEEIKNPAVRENKNLWMEIDDLHLLGSEGQEGYRNINDDAGRLPPDPSDGST